MVSESKQELKIYRFCLFEIEFHCIALYSMECRSLKFVLGKRIKGEKLNSLFLLAIATINRMVIGLFILQEIGTGRKHL